MTAIEQAVKESVKDEVNQLPPTLTAQNLHDYLKIGWNKVYELLRSNEIPNRKIGRQYRVNRIEFVQWLHRKEEK